jgi:hypothetical protein
MIDQFLDYYRKAKLMQECKFQGFDHTEQDVNDDLCWNVPIYDVVNRKYAAFSSFLEAVKGYDYKGNAKYFYAQGDRLTNDNFIKLCYLFRLCGSGINYKPKKDGESPLGTHGFGNFWIVDELHRGFTWCEDWIYCIPDSGFCDVKGYMLPMIKGGLYKFIKNNSNVLMDELITYISTGDKKGIKDVVDYGNEWLVKNGFKRQKFVLTAFAMDMAEYFPHKVDRDSDVYVGSNAKKCLKMILPNMKDNEALRYLCSITNNHSKPYDMEDVACDFIRYIQNFQSPDHIKMNNNVIYKNNVCK